MQNQLKDFYQEIEKKYLPNGQKDIYIGAKSLFNILDKEVDIKTCETIFLKAIAVLALNSETFTLEKLKEHLTASGAEMLFSEAQALHFHNLLQAVRRLAYDGSSLSQSVKEIEVKDAKKSPNFIKRVGIIALLLVTIIAVPLIVSNVFLYYFGLIVSSDIKFLLILLGFVFIPTVWLLNNIAFAFLSILARKNELNAKLQLALGVCSLMLAAYAAIYTLTTYEIISVVSIANLLTSAMIGHASFIFIQQSNIKLK